MEFKCKCIGSGIGFGGNCGRCGMMKTPITNINTTPIVERLQPYQTANNILLEILQLEKYQPTFEGLMEESEEFGEYVKFEDVIKIFCAENK